MSRVFLKVPDVPDRFVITVMRAHARARNAYMGEPGTSGTPGTPGTSSRPAVSCEVAR